MGGQAVERTFEWHLRAAPDALWPIVSDTARLNEVLGLPPYRLTETFRDDLRVRRGEAEEDGVTVRWEEPGFEWVEGRWWSWRRHHEGGPFLETGASLTLEPHGEGWTRARYTLRADPAGSMGRLLLASGHLKEAAARFGGVLAAADLWLRQPTGEFFSAHLGASRQASNALAGLPDEGSDGALLERLGRWLSVAPAADRAFIAPPRLARALVLPLHAALRGCLLASGAGRMRAVWRATCPACGGARDLPSLASLAREALCPRCGAAYEEDLAETVTLGFATGDAALHCATGPATAPRVALRQIVGGMERREIEVPPPPGPLRVMVEDGPSSTVFDPPSGIAVTLSEGGIEVSAAEAGVAIENRTRREAVISLERPGPGADELTAAAALRDQGFRELSPDAPASGEALAAGEGAILLVESAALPTATVLAAAREAGGAAYALDGTVWRLVLAGGRAALAADEALRAADPALRSAWREGPLTAIGHEGTTAYAGPVVEEVEAAVRR